PYAAVLLELVDQRVDAARGQRVAADQQRMERQRLAQLVVAHEARNRVVDRSPGAVLDQRRGCLDHRGEVQERHGAELDVAFLVDRRRVFEERVVAGDVSRIEPGNLAAQLDLVVRIVEAGPVGPAEAVERRDRHQLDVLGHVVPGQRPQLPQAIGVGDHGRTGVEGETFTLPVVRPPAGLVARLDQRRRDARGLEANGERQPAEPGADPAGALALETHKPSPKRGGGPAAGWWRGTRCRRSACDAYPFTMLRMVPRPLWERMARSARPIGTGGLPQ